MKMRPLQLTGVGAMVGLTLGLPVAYLYTSSTGGPASAGAGASATPATSGSASAQVVPTPASTGSAPPKSGKPSRRSRSTAPPRPRRVVATGATVQTQYGPVQVRVTVSASTGTPKLVDVTALQLPQGGNSSRISSYAGPQLRQEALASNGSRVDTVSGATYTSGGYRQSLQSALDAANKVIGR